MSATPCNKEVLPGCAREFGAMNVKLDDLAKSSDAILHHLEGNGQPGLIKDVDRLKQTNKRNVWLWRAVAVAVIGLMIEAIKKHLGI
jgi:hypothetical protein